MDTNYFNKITRLSSLIYSLDAEQLLAELDDAMTPILKNALVATSKELLQLQPLANSQMNNLARLVIVLYMKNPDFDLGKAPLFYKE